MLRRDGDDYEVISNGVFLMDTRDGRSERLLVTAALDAHPAPRVVMVGGLGVGFSLRAALDDARVEHVTVVELESAIVGWHATHLAGWSGGALRDPRVEVAVADLRAHLSDAAAAYDVICLDVDNGPTWTVTDDNRALYGDTGTHLVMQALRRPGVLSVWSAQSVPDYEQRLRDHGATVSTHTVDVARGEPDVVYVARLG